VAAVALVVVLAIQPARRRLAGGVGAAVVLLAAVGTFVIGWHRPSDVVAALGVVAVSWGSCELALARLDVPGLALPGLAPPRPEAAAVPVVPDRAAAPVAAVPERAPAPVTTVPDRAAAVREPVAVGTRGPGPTLAEVGVATVPLPAARPRGSTGRRLPETLVRLQIRDVAPDRPGDGTGSAPVGTGDRADDRHPPRARTARRRYAPAPGSRRGSRAPQRRGGR
jgi:hypothetical protein